MALSLEIAEESYLTKRTAPYLLLSTRQILYHPPPKMKRSGPTGLGQSQTEGWFSLECNSFLEEG